MITGKHNLYVCCFFACLSLLLLVCGYFSYANPGFVGGSIRPYEYAMEAFYQAIVTPGVILSVYFMVLGWRARQQNITKPLIFSVIALLYLMLAVLFADQFYYSHLDHGQGG